MSSALKPVLTPGGTQNSTVPSNMNKPMHPQGAATNYGQPVSHIPQNLVNIPHNPPSSTNLHANIHPASNHNNSNNHYSLNVPNASQHYSVGGNSHPIPVSNHPVASQPHPPPLATFSSPTKTSPYNPNIPSNIGNVYKPPAVANPPPAQPLSAPSIPEESASEKPQSNGTPEKPTLSAEAPKDYCTTPTKEKPPPSPIVTPEKKVQEELVSELKQSVDLKKSPEVVSSSEPADKNASPTGAKLTVSTPPAVTTTTSNATSVSPSTTNTTVAPVAPPPVKTPPTQASPSSVDESESSESQDSVSPVAASKPKETNQKPAVKSPTTPKPPARKAKVSPKVEQGESSKAKTSPETKSLNQKSPIGGGKTKRSRTRTQPYQSPLPEVELISKISATTPRSKNIEDKLIIFYKNEFLAVRNSDGGFYICQAVQNIYKSSPKIKILWLSQDKSDKEVYTPDFYDTTDFDCILTNLDLTRVDKGKYQLPPAERIRTDSILRRALAVEKGDATPPSPTEEHPDGLDLSLYKEESQLTIRKSLKRKASAPLKGSAKASSTKKSPEAAKVRKVASKAKSSTVTKAAVLKKTLAAKSKQLSSDRSDRAAKRKLDAPSTSFAKTSSVVDQKKAAVLAKVARKAPVLPLKAQPSKNIKPAKRSPPAKKAAPTVAAKKEKVVVTRKSKRGKK